METNTFQHIVWNYYNGNKREMPWRHNDDPYKVLISEVMLQQTQVPRVRIKYAEFIERFPTVEALANASFAEVLEVWQGLGYNRRALWLLEAAKRIVSAHDGMVPDSVEELKRLKGIGHNTAAAIAVYAYGKREVFVETNIRTVFLHHYFKDCIDKISDETILALVRETLPDDKVRDWYYALMDYGTFLKKSSKASLDKSLAYRKQAPLKGSVREVRGAILKSLSKKNHLSYDALFKELEFDRERFDKAVAGLVRDKLLVYEESILKI